MSSNTLIAVWDLRPSCMHFQAYLSTCRWFLHGYASNVAGNDQLGKTFWMSCILGICALLVGGEFDHPSHGLWRAWGRALWTRNHFQGLDLIGETHHHNSHRCRPPQDGLSNHGMPDHNRTMLNMTTNAVEREANSGAARLHSCS